MGAPQWAVLTRRSLLPFIIAFLFAFIVIFSGYRIPLYVQLRLIPYSIQVSLIGEVYLKLSKNQWRLLEDNGNLGKVGNCETIWQNGSGSKVIKSLTKLQKIGFGWNKNVYEINGVALKTINLKGKSLKKCIRNRIEVENCLARAISGFIKELDVLARLQNDPNVPRMFAYCIPLNPVYNIEKVAVVIEKGQPLDMIYLVQRDWYQRLHMFDEIIRFFQRNRPYIFNDIRRQQFVIIKGRPYLADFDDILISGNFFGKNEHTARQLYDSFMKSLFWYGNPRSAETHLSSLKESYENGTLSMDVLVREVEALKGLQRQEI